MCTYKNLKISIQGHLVDLEPILKQPMTYIQHAWKLMRLSLPVDIDTFPGKTKMRLMNMLSQSGKVRDIVKVSTDVGQIR